MASDYPYMLSNNKIKPILDAVQVSAKPTKFTHEFLKNLGFTSSNDRAVIPLLRKLGFLNENGAPTEYYDDLRDASNRGRVIAERMKELYSDLYTINTEIHKASDDEIKGAISRVTGKDETSVNRYFNTFKALTNIADFSTPSSKKEKNIESEQEKNAEEVYSSSIGEESKKPEFHYNIQIHLPATTDVSVYNAIFKSLKESLLL